MLFHEVELDQAWKDNELPESATLFYFLCYSIRNGNVGVDYRGHFAKDPGTIFLQPGEGEEGWHQELIYYLLDKAEMRFMSFERLSAFADLSPEAVARMSSRMNLSPKMLEAMSLAIGLWREGKETPWLPMTRIETCGECGKDVAFWFNGKTLALDDENTMCAEPGGLQNYTVELDISSGEMIVANDLRELMLEDCNFNINTSIGTKQTVEFYANDPSAGMLSGFCGNSCPAIFQKGDVFRVGRPAYDEETDEHVAGAEEEWGKQVASVCTDLWWWCIMDSELFELRKKQTGHNVSENYIERVKVTPGRYRMTIHKYPDDDWTTESKYATIELVD